VLNNSSLKNILQVLLKFWLIKTMLARFPLQAERTDLRFIRFADWWPAALFGIVALMGVAPDSNARTLLGLL
jgi:hypothetical protein